MWQRLAGVALLAFGCSSDDATTEATYTFSDAAGRACEATLERTSTSSRVLFSAVSCDGEGKTCSSESSPCFQLSVERDGQELRNCPACCKGSSSSFVSGECSAVTCETAADCVYAEATCEEGICTCADGHCD
jgi:hypothetical protein